MGSADQINRLAAGAREAVKGKQKMTPSEAFVETLV